MKEPHECQSIGEVRAEIDAIDHEIIRALSRRFAYVQAASAFKRNETDVHASDRFEHMLKERRAWAEEEGLNPAVIEKLYRDLVGYFIAEELNVWKKASDDAVT